jgi:hypothetical protein
MANPNLTITPLGINQGGTTVGPNGFSSSSQPRPPVISGTTNAFLAGVEVARYIHRINKC